MIDNRVRVLIVDDYPAMCRLLRVALAPRVNVVGEAENGHAALVSTGMLHPDVVLMDYHMPEMDGLAATAQIKRLPHPPKVVLFTCDNLDLVEEPAHRAGVDMVLNKGCSLDLLCDAVLHLADPAIARRV